MLYANGNGRYDREYSALWQALVPPSGQATTIQGELVRAIGRLADEAYRNGNANWNYGYRILISFLASNLQSDITFDQPTLAVLRRDLKLIGEAGTNSDLLRFKPGEDSYDRVTDRVVEWCHSHPKPISHTPNPRLKL